MIVYWSILIFTVLVATIGCNVYQNNILLNTNTYDALESPDVKEIKTESISYAYAFLSFFLMIFFVGNRSYMFDSSAYIKMFNNMPVGLNNVPDIISAQEKGYGFNVISCIFKTLISDNYTVWFFFLVIVQMIPIIKIFKKYSPLFWLSAFIFISDESMGWTLNGVRQFLAVAIVLYAFDWLVDRKLVPFMIVVFLAYTVHVSAILWVPVYFLVNMKPWNKMFLFLTAVGTVAIILLINKTDFLVDVLEEASDTAGSEATLYLENSSGSSFLRTVMYGFTPGLAFFYRKDIEIMNPPKYIKILTNLSVVTVAISFVANFTNGLFIGRLPIFFHVGTWVLLPWIYVNCIPKRSKQNVLLLIFIAFLTYFVKYTENYSYISTTLGLYLS